MLAAFVVAGRKRYERTDRRIQGRMAKASRNVRLPGGGREDPAEVLHMPGIL